ncbi:lipase maturation factor 1 [Reticulomyxa filosa]|uniref:Lipase maturation factor 1 n=1 Tax=Reticulomyxa filosa TaxID=46433 RepID=X6NPQ8_RETFI|nr:lipase maturation factor 1 [Reticulomyxa filosa]|eukprot:ETO28285.1 lipase maturation factor 1 [Reticulomyxa filosa]
MDYHYETQPNPNPLSWYLHNNSHWFHVFEVAVNHFVELIACWLLLVPLRKCWLIGAIIQITFQLILIVSGNLSFLNWLTMIPALAGLDDLFLARYLRFLFWPKEIATALKCQAHCLEEDKKQQQTGGWSYIQAFNPKQSSTKHAAYQCLALALTALIGVYSLPVVENLISPGQIMNTSFDNFRIVFFFFFFFMFVTNSVFEIVIYFLFCFSFEMQRHEVIFEVTHDSKVNKYSKWTEVIFKCKPGPLDRRPCVITPYHYRLDWQIWFAGFPPHSPFSGRNAWIFLFARQLLLAEKATLDLLDQSFVKAFYGDGTDNKTRAPTFIRAQMYLYQFTDDVSEKNWWKRTKTLDNYLPPIHLKDHQFQDILRQLGR